VKKSAKKDEVACPDCGIGMVGYVGTSDRWECDSCNYTDLFRPEEDD